MAEQKTSDDKVPLSGFRLAKGDDLKLVKEAMEKVKGAFYKSVKDNFGFVPEIYEITDVGFIRALMGGQSFVNVVRLTKSAGGYNQGGIYGSIRVSRVVGTKDPQPYVLAGYICGPQTRGYVLQVREGAFIFDGHGIIDSDTVEAAKDGVLKGIPIGYGVYLPFQNLSYVQELVNQVEDEILQKVDLKGAFIGQFTVIKALRNLGPPPPIVGAPVQFKARIALSSRNGFVPEIDVQFSRSSGTQIPVITVGDAFLFG